MKTITWYLTGKNSKFKEQSYQKYGNEVSYFLYERMTYLLAKMAGCFSLYHYLVNTIAS